MVSKFDLYVKIFLHMFVKVNYLFFNIFFIDCTNIDGVML